MLLVLLVEVTDVFELPESAPLPGSFAKFFFAPVLKSVSYQPDPASLKAGAETFFFKADAPHSGQSLNGASDIFCNASCGLPQAPHTYS